MSSATLAAPATTRIFIVGPTDRGVAEGDTLHQVCRTTEAGDLFDLYMIDKYEVLDTCGSLSAARRLAIKHGCRTPEVL